MLPIPLAAQVAAGFGQAGTTVAIQDCSLSHHEISSIMGSVLQVHLAILVSVTPRTSGSYENHALPASKSHLRSFDAEHAIAIRYALP